MPPRSIHARLESSAQRLADAHDWVVEEEEKNRAHEEYRLQHGLNPSYDCEERRLQDLSSTLLQHPIVEVFQSDAELLSSKRKLASARMLFRLKHFVVTYGQDGLLKSNAALPQAHHILQCVQEERSLE